MDIIHEMNMIAMSRLYILRLSNRPASRIARAFAHLLISFLRDAVAVRARIHLARERDAQTSITNSPRLSNVQTHSQHFLIPGNTFMIKHPSLQKLWKFHHNCPQNLHNRLMCNPASRLWKCVIVKFKAAKPSPSVNIKSQDLQNPLNPTPNHQ